MNLLMYCDPGPSVGEIDVLTGEEEARQIPVPKELQDGKHYYTIMLVYR